VPFEGGDRQTTKSSGVRHGGRWFWRATLFLNRKYMT
jgi:hypothetical protein